jgi:hypothetical protein
MHIVELITGPAEGRIGWLHPSCDLAFCDGFREELNPSTGYRDP